MADGGTSSAMLTPPSSMHKRARTDEGENMETNAAAGGSGGASSIAAIPGAPIFPPRGPLKGINNDIHYYQKKFYIKIYADDWNSTSDSAGFKLRGFMKLIPWQALAFYLSPDEYMEIVRQSSYAKIESSNFEMKFKAVRTPFDANSADVAEANGNLQFDLKRWDGIEQMLPFRACDVGIDNVVTYPTTYIELIDRLYSTGNLSQKTTLLPLPATMRERSLSWRPEWAFHTNTGSQDTSSGPTYRNLNALMSTIPIGEFETDSVNTNMAKMTEGYCFNKSYRPKNGILTMASSAYAPKYSGNQGVTRINTKTRFSDVLNFSSTPITIPNNAYQQYRALFPSVSITGDITVNKQTIVDGNTVANLQALTNYNLSGTGDSGIYTGATHAIPTPPARLRLGQVYDDSTMATVSVVTNVSSEDLDAESTNDNYGYGYGNAMAYYSYADLENYSTFTSRNDPPIHHMPSMLIGAVPKTNKDNSIVNATFEFEITTSIVVKMNTAHPTYFGGMTYNAIPYGPDYPEGFQSGLFTNASVFGGRYQHNETDVALFDDKFWNKSYGLGAKPTFDILPINMPLINKK